MWGWGCWEQLLLLAWTGCLADFGCCSGHWLRSTKFCTKVTTKTSWATLSSLQSSKLLRKSSYLLVWGLRTEEKPVDSFRHLERGWGSVFISFFLACSRLLAQENCFSNGQHPSRHLMAVNAFFLLNLVLSPLQVPLNKPLPPCSEDVSIGY